MQRSIPNKGKGCQVKDIHGYMWFLVDFYGTMKIEIIPLNGKDKDEEGQRSFNSWRGSGD